MRAGTTATGICVEVLEGAEELRALAPHWEALARESAEPNPFYEPWMLLPALEAYGTEGLRCAAVWDNGTLGALVPLKLERRYRGLPVAVARTWRHRNLLLGTPLVRPKNAAACLAALLASGIAPVIELEYIPADGLFYAALVEAAGEHAWAVTDAFARALLVRDRDPRRHFNSNLKNNLRRSEARLAERGRVQYVRLRPGDDIEKWTDDFLRLEASGWKGRQGTALACREDDRRFALEVFREGFRRGQLLISGIDLDGRAVGREVLFMAGEGAFSFKIAYDEDCSRASPGILTEVNSARQLVEGEAGALRWIDSFTAPENHTIGRLWRDRRTVQRIAIGVGGAGRLAVAALPLMRLAKQLLRRKKDRAAPTPQRGAGSAPAAGAPAAGATGA